MLSVDADNFVLVHRHPTFAILCLTPEQFLFLARETMATRLTNATILADSAALAAGIGGGCGNAPAPDVGAGGSMGAGVMMTNAAAGTAGGPGTDAELGGEGGAGVGPLGGAIPLDFKAIAVLLHMGIEVHGLEAAAGGAWPSETDDWLTHRVHQDTLQ